VIITSPMVTTPTITLILLLALITREIKRAERILEQENPSPSGVVVDYTTKYRAEDQTTAQNSCEYCTVNRVFLLGNDFKVDDIT